MQDHALRPAEKGRQSSGVIARGREDLVGSEAPVGGGDHEVQAKLLVAVNDSLELRGEGRTAVRQGVGEVDSAGPG